MKLIIFFILLFLIFMGFNMKNHQGYFPSEGEERVNKLLSNTAKIIQSKYGLQPCGVGVAMPGGPIREVTLCFETKNSFTKEQLRNLLIESSKELLDQVRSDEKIQKFLKERPFTIKNVEIIIYNHDKNGRGLRDPQISIARISQGTLIYLTIDPENSFNFKNEYEETYEEALNLIKNNLN